MRTHRHSPSRARGFSLVELMVALTVGAILLAGAVSLFISNRTSYTINNDLSRLQENARFAMETMMRDIRMARYLGCADDPTKVNDNVGGAAGALWNPTNPVEGFEQGGATWLPSGLAQATGNDGAVGEIVANTDALTLRYLAANLDDADGDTVADYLVTDVTGTTVLTVDSGTDFTAGLVAGIGDCGSTDVFRITSVTVDDATDPTSPADITANALTRSYEPDRNPIVAPYVGVRYYIGNDGNGPVLFRSTIDNVGGALTETRQALVDGVENMQLLYGVDTDGDGSPNVYLSAGATDGGTGADLTAAAGHSWDNVVTIRIGLLHRTVDEFGQETNMDTYNVNGFNVTANDRRRRRVFHTTATLRN